MTTNGDASDDDFSTLSSRPGRNASFEEELSWLG